MTISSEPNKTKIDEMFTSITTDMILPLMKLSDRGEVKINHAQWCEIRDSVKQQVAELYFGTHERLELLDDAER